MKYFMGVDGGATKTLAVVADSVGRIAGLGRSGPANHQTAGPDGTEFALREAIGEALAAAGLSLSDLAGAVLGLAGADYPSDFEMLGNIAARVLTGVPVKLVNDCWVALRGGTRCGWGVVSIAGTGANTAGRNPEGHEHIVMGMDYALGTRGGAGDIANEALHRAFRASQHAGPPTRLTKELPEALGAPDMATLRERAYAGGVSSIAFLTHLAPLVFELARQGDRVCQDVLITIGSAQGEEAAGVIKTLGMTDLAVDVVLAGSVWNGNCPLMIDAFTLALHRVAPYAHPKRTEFHPAVGACLMSLEQAGIEVTYEHYRNFEETAGAAVLTV